MATIAADALTGRSVAQQHRNPGGLADRSPGVSFDSAIDALMSIANDLDQGGRPSGKSSVARVLAQAAVAPTRPLQTQAGSQLSTSTPAQTGAADPKVVVSGRQGERQATPPSLDPPAPPATAHAQIAHTKN